MPPKGRKDEPLVTPVEQPKPKPSKNQQLVDFWISKKYWESPCLDAAIDWSNHPTQFNAEQMVEFHEWLSQVENLKKQVVKLVPAYDNIVELLKLL